ncbi:MAG: GntR family transcriptional regulator [Eubacteriales bacterium]|nr:GntR family transcriptional regulator [Eubacteriales bacterium]
MKWEFNGKGPIAAQIVLLVEQAIARGELAPGEWLPSVRELAAEASVNPNTMQKALLELEQNGLVNTVRNTGKSVTTDTELIRATRDRLVEESIRAFLADMKSLGLDRAEVSALMERRVS